MPMKFSKVISLVLILSVCFMCAGCTGGSSEGIIVAGSTSVQPYAEVLAEEYVRFHASNYVDIQGGGSSAGITAVESGTADIGMSSRNLKESERGLWSVEIARDGLAIIVHTSNPIANLSSDEIQGIYTGAITNWAELGGINGNIHIITREEGSGTRSAFEELVMGDARITPRAIVQDSNGSVRQLVSGDPNSIGFISLGLVDNTVKAIQLDGVPATHENVANGNYSLFRPFLFVCNVEPVGTIRQFIDFVLSDEGQPILTSEGLVSLIEVSI